MSLDLKPGLRFAQTITVDERLTVPFVSRAFTGFSDMPPVFATAFLVGFVEWTCVEALRPALVPRLKTVGTHIDLSHSAATPIGMKVTAEVELALVNQRWLRFKVSCFDEVDVICTGQHDRTIIDAAKFMAHVEKKRVSIRAGAAG